MGGKSKIRPCSIDGCAGIAGESGSARGWCRSHYHLWQRYGSPYAEKRRVYSWNGALCNEPGCAKPIMAHGLCDTHYARNKRNIDPVAARARSKAFLERLEEKRIKDAGRPRAANCDICGESGKTVFDHCHARGHFRGWLCDRCNRTLGQVKDDAQLLRKMIKYLEVTHDKPYIQAA